MFHAQFMVADVKVLSNVQSEFSLNIDVDVVTNSFHVESSVTHLAGHVNSQVAKASSNEKSSFNLHIQDSKDTQAFLVNVHHTMYFHVVSFITEKMRPLNHGHNIFVVSMSQLSFSSVILLTVEDDKLYSQSYHICHHQTYTSSSFTNILDID